jgi:protein gp37
VCRLGVDVLHCYAAGIAARFHRPGLAFAGYATAGGHWTGRVDVFPEKFEEPMHWKPGTWVFINSMSDLGQPAVDARTWDAMLARVVIRQDLTFIGLTKWPERLADLLYGPIPGATRRLAPGRTLPNLILGTSIESQAYAPRAAALLDAWGGRAVVSAEPLLGPLDLTPYLQPCPSCRGTGDLGFGVPCPPTVHRRRLAWVIAGGESGPGARPCQVAWLRRLRDQCAQAGVAFFCKQVGARPMLDGQRLRLRSRKGADPAEWPEDLRRRQFPDRAEVPHA